MIRLGVVVLVVGASLVPSGCHESTGNSSRTAEPGHTAGAKRVDAELRVTGFPLGAPDETVPVENTTVELRCPAKRPAHKRACATVATDPEIFEPTPADVACTEIWGGPQRALVEGTVDGRKIDAAFSRTNGCEIARWDRAKYLLELALPDSKVHGVPPGEGVDVVIG